MIDILPFRTVVLFVIITNITLIKSKRISVLPIAQSNQLEIILYLFEFTFTESLDYPLLRFIVRLTLTA